MNARARRLIGEVNLEDAIADINEVRYHHNSNYYEYFEGVYKRIFDTICFETFTKNGFERIDLRLDWKHFLHCVTLIRE